MLTYITTSKTARKTRHPLAWGISLSGAAVLRIDRVNTAADGSWLCSVHEVDAFGQKSRDITPAGGLRGKAIRRFVESYNGSEETTNNAAALEALEIKDARRVRCVDGVTSSPFFGPKTAPRTRFDE